MQISSRLIVTAAVAGAAALLPLAAAAPANAAPADGIPTAADLSVTLTGSTVMQGGDARYEVVLSEAAGGQPEGLTGRIDIEATQNGTNILSMLRGIKSTKSVFVGPLSTTAAGPITVTATFVEATENESGAKSSASLIVLGKAAVSVQTTTVHAGDSISPVVDMPAGSTDADGRLEATAPGMAPIVCGPRIVSSTSASCPLEVPKDLASGTYTMTFTYGASPMYGDASTTADIQVVGDAAATTSHTGTPSTVSRTSTSGGTRTSGGSVVVAGTTSSTTSGGLGTGAAVSGSASGAAGAVPTPAAPDDPAAQPTAVAAQVPTSQPGPIAAAPAGVAASSVLAMLPMLLPFIAAGLIGLLLLVLLIVLLVRRARRTA